MTIIIPELLVQFACWFAAGYFGITLFALACLAVIMIADKAKSRSYRRDVRRRGHIPPRAMPTPRS